MATGLSLRHLALAALLTAGTGAAWSEPPAAEPGTPDAPVAISLTVAQDAADEFARRGDGLITFADIEAYMDRLVPAAHRPGFLADPDRIGKMLQNLATPRQVALLAMEQGLHRDPLIQSRMLQGLVTLLADEYLARHTDENLLDDYEAMARETFLRSPPTGPVRYSFTQILIRPEPDEVVDAMRDVVTVADRLAADPSVFDQLVAGYSDDPAAASNHGVYEQVSVDSLIDEVAAALEAVEIGQITGPVRSKYGWHWLRLDQRHAPETLEFDQVRAELIEQERQRHRELIQGRLLSELARQPLQITEGAVESLLERYNSSFDAYSRDSD